MKKLHFENIGPDKATYDFGIADCVSIADLVADSHFLARKVEKHILGAPQFLVDCNGTHIGVLVDGRIQGEIWFTEGTAK